MRYPAPALALAVALAACSSDPPAVAPTDAALDATTDATIDTNTGPDACELAMMMGTPRPCTCVDGRMGNLQGCDPPGCFCTGDAAVDAPHDVIDVSVDAVADVPAGDAAEDRPDAADSGCGREQTLCSGRCVYLQLDLANCGSCGTVCRTTLSHAHPGCLPVGTTGGTCAFGCDPGWFDCNGRDTDGCEQALAGDAGCRPL